MKKLFSEPEMKVSKFEYEDMVRTSVLDNDTDIGDSGWGGDEDIG